MYTGCPQKIYKVCVNAKVNTNHRTLILRPSVTIYKGPNQAPKFQHEPLFCLQVISNFQELLMGKWHPTQLSNTSSFMAPVREDGRTRPDWTLASRSGLYGYIWAFGDAYFIYAIKKQNIFYWGEGGGKRVTRWTGRFFYDLQIFFNEHVKAPLI